nr:MAG TPA: hypothetical protein [Caudoviricetes sp.]
MSKTAFEKETDLCAAFISILPDEWTAYPETGGFDILLVRKEDGFQIGIEAKLRLNAKVINQVAEGVSTYSVTASGPDCRAVLIPYGVTTDLAGICRLLNITVITVRKQEWNGEFYAYPYLPRTDSEWSYRDWTELFPESRIELPDWVPDVIAGDKAPVALTPWKIVAIKVAVTLEKRGFVTRKDFAHFDISMSRWTQSRWIVPGNRGEWLPGLMPDFRSQHPVNYPQIAADYEKWKSPEQERSPEQQSLGLRAVS